MHALLTGSQHTHEHRTHAELHTARLLGGGLPKRHRKVLHTDLGPSSHPTLQSFPSPTGPGPWVHSPLCVPFLTIAPQASHCLLRACDTWGPPGCDPPPPPPSRDLSPATQSANPSGLSCLTSGVFRPFLPILVPGTRGKCNLSAGRSGAGGLKAGTRARAPEGWSSQPLSRAEETQCWYRQGTMDRQNTLRQDTMGCGRETFGSSSSGTIVKN